MADLDREALKQTVFEVLSEMQLDAIPIGISNRHVHLTEEHFKSLFPGETLQPYKDLKQPGEFASDKTVTLSGPKGEIKRVRILGPLRKRSQVEVSLTDARNLGIPAPIRLSGNLDDAAEITLKSEGREITFRGCIAAKRHIHMSFKEMESHHLSQGDLVKVKVNTPERTTIFEDVEIRPGEKFVLEMHVDTDEANAANIKPGTTGSLIRE